MVYIMTSDQERILQTRTFFGVLLCLDQDTTPHFCSWWVRFHTNVDDWNDFKRQAHFHRQDHTGPYCMDLVSWIIIHAIFGRSSPKITFSNCSSIPPNSTWPERLWETAVVTLGVVHRKKKAGSFLVFGSEFISSSIRMICSSNKWLITDHISWEIVILEIYQI